MLIAFVAAGAYVLFAAGLLLSLWTRRGGGGGGRPPESPEPPPSDFDLWESELTPNAFV